MSWSECHPIFTEEMVDEYEASATFEEKAQLEEWYGVREVFNAQPEKSHVVCFSLFWKPSSVSKKVYPKPTREILMNAANLGLDLRFPPWPHYIQPILDGVPELMAQFDDVVARVYLAADLDFLVEDFVKVGCEVFLMRHPSIAHAPGVAWRVLGFSEKNRLVTMVDSDRIKDAANDIERTRAMAKDGLGTWRAPVCIDHELGGRVAYKPFIGCQMGAQGGWSMDKLIRAFTWHTLRGTLPLEIDIPGCGPTAIGIGYWADFGFEEWFLATTMFPRMVGNGMVTFVPAGANSNMLLLDIEYATWANPKSQLVIVPSKNCCGVSHANYLVRETSMVGEAETPTSSSQPGAFV